MTRKDYILLAGALKLAREQATEDKLAAERAGRRSNLESLGELLGINRAGYRNADVLSTDNPRFNREHFLAVVRGQKALESRPPWNGGR